MRGGVAMEVIVKAKEAESAMNCSPGSAMQH